MLFQDSDVCQFTLAYSLLLGLAIPMNPAVVLLILWPPLICCADLVNILFQLTFSDLEFSFFSFYFSLKILSVFIHSEFKELSFNSLHILV